MKKFVFIDTNFCNEDGSCRIHELQARRQKLTEGDLVTAYMEQEQWDARVVRCGGQWGVVLLSETRALSAERYEGQQEGYHNGRLIEQLRVLRVLEGLDLPEDLMVEAKRRLELA